MFGRGPETCLQRKSCSKNISGTKITMISEGGWVKRKSIRKAFKIYKQKKSICNIFGGKKKNKNLIIKGGICRRSNKDKETTGK